VGFVAKHTRLRQAVERRSVRISSLLARSGEVGNPYVTSAKSLTNSLVATVVLVPLSAVLTLFVWQPLLFISALPLAFYLAPEVRLRDKVSQRREGVEGELPFFSILVNVLGSAGVPFHSVLAGVRESDVFPRMKVEAGLVRRDVRVFGADPNEALERLAFDHPSKKFGSFVNGYTSKVRSGGDMSAYLSGESGFLLRELEDEWARYVGRAGMIGSMMITVFGLIPLLLLVVGVFSPSVSVLGLVAFTAVGVPAFTVLLVYLAGRMQPAGDVVLSGRVGLSAVAAAPAFGLLLLTGQMWVAAAGTLVVFSLTYGLSVRRQLSERRDIDEALPRFIKDVLEFRRQDYDLTRSLVSIATNNRYNSSFDRIMTVMAVQLKSGVPVDELELDPKTRLARIVFMVLGQMGRSGGGTVDTVFQLSAYTTKVVETKRNTLAEMRPYIILSYLSPVLLAFGVTFVGGMLKSFGKAAAPGITSLSLGGLQFGGVSPAMMETATLLIVVSAAALGVIASKMVDFTVKNTLRSSTNVIVAVTATYLFSTLGLSGLLHLVP
jgi:flagellar protein FlaJ